MDIRMVFMGSPEFAVPILRALAENYQVISVISQPDRPAGRGQQLSQPPIKNLALELGLEVFQPERLRSAESYTYLNALTPDLIVVAAYGQILRQNILDLPRLGCINVHGSLLPRWRGAAPIQATLLHGDKISGVTIMKMDAGVDTGGILASREVAILPDDTTASLSPRLAKAGAELLIHTLPGYLSGKIVPVPQEESRATFAPMIHKEDGLLNLSKPVQELINQIRAFNPWPGTYLSWSDLSLKVLRSHSLSGPDSQPGTRSILERLPAVRAGDAWLVLDIVQPAGKKAMPGRDFLAGARGWRTA
jgi:methionyl-tRNA formyltransferase